MTGIIGADKPVWDVIFPAITVSSSVLSNIHVLNTIKKIISSPDQYGIIWANAGRDNRKQYNSDV